MTLCEVWKKYLEAKGVKIPRVGTWRRKTLEFLFITQNQWISKENIIKGIKYDGSDLQAPRHLSSSGWYIEQDYKGNYKLVTIKKTFPSWISNKRTTNITPNSWKELKQKYNNQCATCGSKEGKPHRHTNKKTKLEKGHKDPTLDLTIGNTIPQCNYCNKRFKDTYKFDNYGISVMIKLKGVWYDIPNYNRIK
jgi:hypothetical protein